MRHLQIHDKSAYRRELKLVQKAREQVASICSRLPDHQLASTYNGNVGQTHKALVSRLLSERPASKKELQRAVRLAKKLPDDLRESGAVGRLLAAMVYNRAYELPQYYALETVPEWLLKDYVQYMTNPAFLFCTAGESDRYFEHMRHWVKYLHQSIMENPNSKLWTNVANTFVRIGDFGPLYFNDHNVISLYSQRGDIIEHVLRSNNYQIDHEFIPRSESSPLRIGILSQHCEASPETYAMLPVFEHLDHGFEIVLYILQSGGGDIEGYCRNRVQALRVLPSDLKKQAESIRADDIDVLFIATNVTSTCNPVCYLAAHRLARVQIAGTGSVTTTGLPNIDYYLTGRLTDKEQNNTHYRESLLWLDGPAHCFSYGPSTRSHVVTISRSMLGITDDAIVYVSGANIFKILPELMVVWAKLLSSQQDSVLLLYPYGPNWSSSYPKELFARRLGDYLKAEGVSERRLFILDPDPVPDRHQIREYLRVSDVYLDSFPFSATTSLIEPLEVGLPVVSLRGKCFRSSMGAALLEATGLNDLVAESDDEYLNLARNLGKDAVRRASIGHRIKAAMEAKPAFLDSPGYARQVGRLFYEITRQ